MPSPLRKRITSDKLIHTKRVAENLDHLFSFPFSRVAEVAEWAGSAADVAGPRPREVGGACRIQVLAAARTQETVGGPNGAKRSEFRRCCPPVGVTQLKRKALKAGNAHGTSQTTWSNTRQKKTFIKKEVLDRN